MQKRLLYLTLIILMNNCFYLKAQNVILPDSTKKDSLKNVVIIYDTLRTEKIIYIYDTLTVYDTIVEYVPDGNNIEKDGKFSVSPFASWFLPVRTMSFSENYNSFIKLKDETERMKAGYEFGSYVSYQSAFGQLSSGLSYSFYLQDVDYKITEINTTPYTTITITDSSYWNITPIDTFYQIIGADTFPVIVADSSWIIDTDTSIQINYDSTVIKNNYKGKNTYRYIKVPLIFSKTIYRKNRFSANAGIGCVFLFKVKSSGRTIMPPDKMILTDINNDSFVKVNYLLHAEISLAYEFTKNHRVFICPFYNYMIKNDYTSDNVTRYKTDLIGITLGVSFFL